jgi:acetyltransferase-like isoleucine patch superfamily enzyme
VICCARCSRLYLKILAAQLPTMRKLGFFAEIRIRLLQELSMHVPGGASIRVKLHRWRGVEIGHNVWIGYQVMLETGYPNLIHIGDNVFISMRVTILAHFREQSGVWIENGVFIGPCACILPNVRLGEGCVVTAGSVVTSNVPPYTVVQGNPARIVAKSGISLVGDQKTVSEFQRQLSPIR